MTPFRYVLVVYALLFPYAYAFFSFQERSIANWLLWIALASTIPFVVISLVVLFRGDKKSRLVFLTTWALYFLLWFTPIGELTFQVAVLGFRIHVGNVEEFLASNCRLNEFVENGVKQKVGQCNGFGDDPFFDRIIYDSSGEIAMPLSRRSPDWTDAMWNSSPKRVLRDSEGRAQHLFGNFYVVPVHLTELEG